MLIGSVLLAIEGLGWLLAQSAGLSALNSAGLAICGLAWLVLAIGIAMKPAAKSSN